MQAVESLITEFWASHEAKRVAIEAMYGKLENKLLHTPGNILSLVQIN